MKSYLKNHFLSLLATSFAREYDQFSLVLLQSSHIQFQALLTQIASPMVDRNSQFKSLFWFETSLCKFFVRESSSFTNLDVVSSSRTSNCWTEESGWTGRKFSCTFCTVETTTLFACWLIKPGSNSTLPVLQTC